MSFKKSGKSCLKCKKISIRKNGFQRGIQRYQCCDCGRNFSSIRRPERLSKKLFKEYLLGKQTLKQLSLKDHHCSRCHFYGKKSARLGTLVFKDILSKKIGACKHIDTETANDYKQLVEDLLTHIRDWLKKGR